MLKNKVILIVLFQIICATVYSQAAPVRMGVVGLTHTHVHWIFNSDFHPEFDIVGIVEPNKDLAQRYADQYAFSMDLVYNTLEEMIAAKQPTAVTAFGTIYDHLKIVEVCAPAGIHVMVEKPLAVSLQHAKKMKQLADKHGIHLLTNYETTWYPTNHKAFELIQQDTLIGDIRKIIVRDGHRGPKKIGVDDEFLVWLTDPVLNGGGAITDFGCYGANLLTWIMEGKKPNSVTAVTAQQQAANNPKVDDEAIIILTYDNAVAILQASWNWPIGRKDMEIYGLKGAIYADNRHDLRVRIARGYDEFTEEQMTLAERESPYHDPFVYFAAVINGTVSADPYDLSSLENNMVVMEILDAAIKSARLNKAVKLK
ncbi:Gfo/Idh/MocA family oxidoreductase [Neolewinella lacunae]|uniref:Gfo/Idh/MocA family oxidoreductase n=1 Tax=Neolewinella lacunae TaxID=1517758 RepID=A0A923PGC6_9BACT|nr:Gfo/Idh/MocA family oxidoreductase [Neolewinella lacunae]MBC6992759.1 Gfo/Idh/MocA family oxidoreductase [Neolewinella lacunae]MDN3636003.1 Gfo/Idh/MocA family oxidoreductase [Neolewinella lacunae]